MAIRGGGNIRRPDRDSTAAWHFDVSTVTRYAHFQATAAGAHRLHRPLRVPAARIQGGKDTAMKIKLYYEDKRYETILEVPDDELTVMVETDYCQRLETAANKIAVKRRSPQEILDTEINAPTYNRNRAAKRSHKSVREQIEIPASVMPVAMRAEYIDLYQAIEKLQPQQQELIKKIFWEGFKQVEIATAEGVEEAAISRRMSRIYARLKKILEN